MSPHELDMLITSFFVFCLIAFMSYIVYADLLKPSKASRWGAALIVFVLMTAPMAFLIKNVYVVLSSWNL